MMKQVPLPLVQMNQSAIVLFVTLAIFFDLPILIYIIAAIQLLGLVSNGKANPIMIVMKLFFGPGLKRAKTQALELARFNNAIAVIMFTASVILLVLNFKLAGFIVAGFVGLAAFVAICGYCIGCTLYYQFKRLKNSSI